MVDGGSVLCSGSRSCQAARSLPKASFREASKALSCASREHEYDLGVSLGLFT